MNKLIRYSFVFFLTMCGVYTYYELRSIHWFQDLGVGGWITKKSKFSVSISEDLPVIASDSKIIIFNHGSAATGTLPDCRNVILPQSIMAMIDLGVFVLYPCSKVTEPFLNALLPWRYRQHEFMRAKELENEIDKLIAIGVKADNIFLSGQSQGGWITLLASALYPHKFNGVISFAPGVALGKLNFSFFSRRETNRQFHYNEVSKAEKIKGLIFYYENDSYGKPGELSFLSEKYGPDLRLITYGCDIPEGHYTAYYDCRLPETIAMLREFIGV